MFEILKKFKLAFRNPCQLKDAMRNCMQVLPLWINHGLKRDGVKTIVIKLNIVQKYQLC